MKTISRTTFATVALMIASGMTLTGCNPDGESIERTETITLRFDDMNAMFESMTNDPTYWTPQGDGSQLASNLPIVRDLVVSPKDDKNVGIVAIVGVYDEEKRERQDYKVEAVGAVRSNKGDAFQYADFRPRVTKVVDVADAREVKDRSGRRAIESQIDAWIGSATHSRYEKTLSVDAVDNMEVKSVEVEGDGVHVTYGYPAIKRR